MAMQGITIPTKPLVENAIAIKRAASTVLYHFFAVTDSSNCHMANIMLAVSKASMRTSVHASIKACADANINAANLPTSALYNILPDLYVAHTAATLNIKDGNL